jgi:hypothetical protein
VELHQSLGHRKYPTKLTAYDYAPSSALARVGRRKLELFTMVVGGPTWFVFADPPKPAAVRREALDSVAQRSQEPSHGLSKELIIFYD